MSTQPQPEGAVELGPGVWIDPNQLRFSFSRSGGPGGQAVNKLSTKAELRVVVASIGGLSDEARDRLRSLAGRRLTGDNELVIVASTSRSQWDNRRECLRRLRALLAEAVAVPKPRTPTKPSRGSVERRLQDKRRASKKKDARRRPEEE